MHTCSGPAARAGAPERVVVAMSGGVDSSVAAALLAEAGHAVVGVTMHLYDTNGGPAPGRCCSVDDERTARRVAAQLGFPHYVIDYRDEFRRAVVDDFVREYASGRTPTPCTRCNDVLKFDLLLGAARRLGARRLATGHYARLETQGQGAGPRLRRAVDRAKDQSYFLFSIGPALGHVLFPLGRLSKAEVRGHARRLGLPNAEKPESMEICFAGGEDYARVVERLAEAGAPSAGDVVDAAGRRLGRHAGVHRYTVGQRDGLGGVRGAAGRRYVLRIVADKNEVVVGDETELLSSSALVRDVRWVQERVPEAPFEATVQIRHRHPGARARVEPDGEAAQSARVLFDAPERAVAPGQAAVFYRDDEVLGGGWIA